MKTFGWWQVRSDYKANKGIPHAEEEQIKALLYQVGSRANNKFKKAPDADNETKQTDEDSLVYKNMHFMKKVGLHFHNHVFDGNFIFLT